MTAIAEHFESFMRSVFPGSRPEPWQVAQLRAAFFGGAIVAITETMTAIAEDDEAAGIAKMAEIAAECGAAATGLVDGIKATN